MVTKDSFVSLISYFMQLSYAEIRIDILCWKFNWAIISILVFMDFMLFCQRINCNHYKHTRVIPGTFERIHEDFQPMIFESHLHMWSFFKLASSWKYI